MNMIIKSVFFRLTKLNIINLLPKQNTMPAEKKRISGFDRDFMKNARNEQPVVTDIVDKISNLVKEKRVLRRQKITAIEAYDILTLNYSNRPVRLSTIEYYSKLMKEGHWQYTPESNLPFDREGHLLDGQQRLWAQVGS